MNLRSFSFGLFLLITAKSALAVKKAIPSDIKKCNAKWEDAEMEQCFWDNINTIKAKLATGIPEMRIPIIEPLLYPEVLMEAGTLLTRFSNFTLVGLSDFDLQKVEFSLKRNFFAFELIFHGIYIEGQYQLKGKLLLLELDSSGHYTHNITNLYGRTSLQGRVEKVNGKSFLRFDEENKISIRIDGLHVFDFEELFKGNPELTKTTNQVINDNIKEVVKDFIPIVEEVVGSFTFRMIKQVFTTFSLEELFDDYA